MFVRTVLVLAAGALWIALWRRRNRLGFKRGVIFVLLALPVIIALLCVDGRRNDSNERIEPSTSPVVAAELPSQSCVECHQSRHASWHKSFHRTMTQDAAPDAVKADFNNVTYTYKSVTSRMFREGDRFLIETVDPTWLVGRGPTGDSSSAPRRVFTVDRIVGSHWFQQMIHRDESGRYLRLPLIYHLVEKRWIHADGAFLFPDAPHFFGSVSVWDESCLFCHNTQPNKRLELRPDKPPIYLSEVAELGISCEACHGPGDRHIRAHKDPALKAEEGGAAHPDSTIVNPAKLDVERSVDVCARCHGIGPKPQLKAWDPDVSGDPFRPGEVLARTHFIFWSDAALAREYSFEPDPIDGRFWSDGTPLTTAHEFQGMAVSKCYQGGRGKMTCLTCHAMHGPDPNHQLKTGMRTNEACYSCHEAYRADLVKHTHHPAESPGSDCYNCHMPYQAFGLLGTHRTHRISIPRVRDSAGSGKPHACNLCHLDKSLGWTTDQLHKWYGTKPDPLPEDERTIAAGVLNLMRGDARTRAVVAGAFGWPPAIETSGRGWAGPVLIRALEEERYSAARYVEHRSLKALHGAAAGYDYLADPRQRSEQLRAMKSAVLAGPRLDPARYPYLWLSGDGRVPDALQDRLLRTRMDPDLFVRE